MTVHRRSFLRGLLAAAGVGVAGRAYAQHVHQAAASPRLPQDAAAEKPRGSTATLAQPGLAPGIVEVQTPDIPKMPWRMENGVKVFDIRAEHVRTEFLPGRVVDAWGFNGSVPGPAIEVNEGDHVRFIVENRLPEVFSMHWHGLEVPIGMDGVPGISQDPIPPAGSSSTSSRCGRTARSSITRTWPCRR